MITASNYSVITHKISLTLDASFTEDDLIVSPFVHKYWYRDLGLDSMSGVSMCSQENESVLTDDVLIMCYFFKSIVQFVISDYPAAERVFLKPLSEANYHSSSVASHCTLHLAHCLTTL